MDDSSGTGWVRSATTKKKENITGKKSTTKADDMYAFEIIYYITARNQP